MAILPESGDGRLVAIDETTAYGRAAVLRGELHRLGKARELATSGSSVMLRYRDVPNNVVLLAHIYEVREALRSALIEIRDEAVRELESL